MPDEPVESLSMPPERWELLLAPLRVGDPGYIKAGILNEWRPTRAYPRGELVYDTDAPRFDRANPPPPHKRGYGLFYESLVDGNRSATPPHKATEGKWRLVDELDPDDGVGRGGGGTLDVCLTRGDVTIRPRWLRYVEVEAGNETPPLADDVLDDWDNVVVSDEPRNWRCIAASETTVIIVAVGTNICARSTDYGASWTDLELPFSPGWMAGWTDIATDGRGMWIIVDYGTRALRSVNDGLTWEEFYFDYEGTWCQIEYGNGVWIVVRGEFHDNILRSTDGIHFERITQGLIYGWPADMTPLVFGNIVIIMNGSGSACSVSRSVDRGVSFNVVGLNTSTDCYYGAHGGGRVIAVESYWGYSSQGISVSDDDGATWNARRVTLPYSNVWGELAYCNGVWLLIPQGFYGYTGPGARSTDGGDTWESVPMSDDTSITWSDIASIANRFIAVGYNSKVVSVSAAFSTNA